MKTLIVVINVLTFISYAQTEQITIPGCVDISLNEIVFHDTISSRFVLGTKNIIPSQFAPLFEFKFLNKHKTQLLTCTFHPGDYLYSLSEFKVEMHITDDKIFIGDSSDTGIIILEDIVSFKSGKEIELGIDSSDVIKIFGAPTKRTIVDGLNAFIYEIKNPISYPEEKNGNNNIEFFNYFKSHMYYSKYKFSDGKIIEFSFGFPYP